MKPEVKPMSDCVFCKIVSGEIPSKKVYEDDKIIVINDLNPGAPVHVLVIPKEHTESILTAKPDILVYIQSKLDEITTKLGIKESGFRVVINFGKDGGQTVPHLHVHILGGKVLGWPPC
jgi:histidine triad (HIT) family protein